MSKSINRTYTLSESDYKVWEMYKDSMRLRYARHIQETEFDELVKNHTKEINKAIGKGWHADWDNFSCDKSPVGKCVMLYDEEFSGEYYCGYCHQPEERK